MNILAVGAHWDDIEIGCALTLVRLRARGASLYGVVLCDSQYSQDPQGHTRTSAAARQEGLLAFEAMSMTYLTTPPQPNQRLQYNQPLMQELEAYALNYAIDLVFTHWYGDHNTDHAAAWEISRVAFRHVPGLLQYQSNSYLDNVKVFTPQIFFGFSAAAYARKSEILTLYASEWQYRLTRWQREIFERERFWGYLCGQDYAEGFLISRLVDNDRLGLAPLLLDKKI